MKSQYLFLILLVLCVTQAFTQPMEPPKDTSLSSLHFISQPPLSGQKGVPYLYTAKAVSNDTSAIIWYESRIPITNVMPTRDLTIDSAAGIVTWTPTMKGWYSIELVARSNKGEIAVQRFSVSISGSNGIITGRVTDTLNNGIPKVIIEVLQASNAAPEHGGYFVYTAITNSSGNYRIGGIDPGNYKLHAVSPTPIFSSQWYDGKMDPLEADVITIADTPGVSRADFTLRGGVLHKTGITVTGSVLDSNYAPIAGSRVFFVQSGFALNSNSTVDNFREFFDFNAPHNDCRIDGLSDHVFHALVDSNGHYSIRIPKGSYIAFSRAPGYATDYFDGQTDILSATQLDLQQDTTDINFTLAFVPKVALGSISGSVFDSTQDVGVTARIIAIRDQWTSRNEFKIACSYIVDTDSLGNYTVDQLLPGSYFVFALPLGMYAPAFYSTDTMSMRWKTATKIVIIGNTITGITIYVHEITSSTRGYAGISGTVHDNSGSSLIPGTLVYAMQNNSIAGYGITDVSGDYSIAGLAPGSYSVVVDKPGYNETSAKSVAVSYTSTGTPVSATADFSLNQTTDVAQGITVLQPTAFELRQNYPNPFNPSTTINYTLAASGSISLKVYNLLGQEVAILANGYQKAGTHQVLFNAQGFASGIYFYRLHTQSADLTKKMILLQ